MELHLKGKSVLITGGSKGIGRAVAEGFAAEGCPLHLAARTARDLEALAEKLRERTQTTVRIHALDLSESGAARELAEACGEVDILINNAGAIPGGDLQSVGEEQWRVAWDLKVYGYIDLTRALLSRMQKRGSGVVLNIIGTAGLRPTAGYIAGSAGNAGLIAFTQALGAVSLAQGVRVLGVNPGPVQTERIVSLLKTRARDEWGDESRYTEYFAAMPLGRAATVEEVAAVVVFLASEKASYVSGTVVTIDGGLSARPA